MSLVDLYVHEVSEHLPAAMREDLGKEIRSLIEDSLEDRSREQGKPIDEEMMVEVLKTFGPPEKMAASYLPPRYLIGPKLYPIFINVLKIVLSVVAVMAAIGLGLTLGQQAHALIDVAHLIGEAVLGLGQAVMQVFGTVALIFALIQWLSPEMKFDRTKEWDPRRMKAEPDEERVKPVGSIIHIFINVLAIWIFNVHPEWIGFNSNLNGHWVSVSVLAPGFFNYLPWISLVWALDAGLTIALVARGRWQSWLRWCSVGINIIGIAIAVWMLLGPAIVSISPADLTRLGWGTPSSEVIRTASEALNNGVRVAIGIVLAISVIKVGKSLYILLFKGRNPVEEALR